MIFDTHAHYDDAAFDPDREEIIAALAENGVAVFVDVSSDMDSVPKVMSLARRYDFAYAAVGIHPSELEELDDNSLTYLEEQIKSEPEKVVAIGEIGLDYHYPEPERELQKHWFIKQLELAIKLDKPVVIHSRDAAEDTRKITSSFIEKGLRGVVHCFSYSAELALYYAERGLYIGIGGVLTFKNARKLKEAVDKLPLESIVLETDCPYLAPEPYRGKRNSSLFLPEVVKTVAEIKCVSLEEVERVTFQNALKLFSIKDIWK